jgi:CBS domain-containing protein
MRIEDVMTREVVSVPPSMSLKDAARLCAEHTISGLPVVDEGRLVGVVSEGDVVAKETSGYEDVSEAEEAGLRRRRAAVTVGEAMTADPIVVERWNSLPFAADLMIVHGVNRLPVIDRSGALVGIVTRTDLVRAFARSDADVEEDIRTRLLPSVGLSPSALDITVERGIVRISGAVESEVVEGCLRATIHLIPGVVEVDWRVPTAAGVL